ncbi:S8 family serine peptidase [Candidatus Uhrbacteria bacterium]|jgi:hypothetical protein|nr:S8 family serine peptidase [Candidatus Uhrbacteria bacterium]
MSFFVSETIDRGIKQIVLSGLMLVLFVLPGLRAVAADVTDPFRDEQWYLDAISAPDAWEISTGSADTVVAVLDAGFDLDHEELVHRYWSNSGEIAGDGIDNDNNGFEDDVMGWDFVDNDPDPSPDVIDPRKDTIISHGTVIAGIIAAEPENGLGITGINWNVSIMPLRTLDENGVGSTVAVRRAVRYAVENGADVINLSLTFRQYDERLANELVWAHDQGVVIVAAVGNGDMDTDVTPIYPACFDERAARDIIIGVASTNQKNQKADFSNFGTSCVDLAAPGTNIFAAAYQDKSEFFLSTAYSSPWQGTSMSAPIVSAAAALLLSTYPSLTPSQVRLAMKLSVDPVEEISLEARKRLGAGLLNVERALITAEQFVGGSSSVNTSRSYDPSGSFVIAEQAGASPLVKRYNDHGELQVDFMAYHPGFTGGVRLVMADVDGDGVEEIITGAGPGGGPQVRIFDLDGNALGQFFAFDEGGRTGIQLAAGDTNGDGVAEIFVVEDEGGTGQVRIFNRAGHLKGSFFPFDRTESLLTIAAGDVDGDGKDELVVSESGRVRVFEGNGRYVKEFTPSQFVDALTLAVGDLDQDGSEEIIVASGRGYEPRLWVYNQNNLSVSSLVFNGGFTGGVAVAVSDIDQNGETEIFVTPLSGGGPQVRVLNAELEPIGGFFAFDQENRFGSSIAIWN